jgi:hypothetical protein
MKKNLFSTLICGALLLSSVQGLAQETAAKDPLAHSLAQTFNPTVYMNLMSQMMTNPAGVMMNPFSTCGQCHTAEDMDRYNTMMGPMMKMMNPANMMNPQTYTNMMAAPMDPEVYTKWYEGWMKKYGGMLAPQKQPAQQ